MNPLLLANKHFHVEIDPVTGGISRIAHPDDPQRMNWISSPGELGWFPRSHEWGLGFANSRPTPVRRIRWEEPVSLRVTGRTCAAAYALGGAKLSVKRRLTGGRLEERYTFTNSTREDVGLGGQQIGAFGIYAPFNDNYPSAAVCVTQRCNAHIWCGENVSYVCCLRMGGEGPHLGLVLTAGDLAGYSIEGRDIWLSSNTRGDIVLNPGRRVLAAGETYSIGWTLFWHHGWEDFFRQAAAFPQFIDLRANAFTGVQGEPLVVEASSSGSLARAKATVGGQPATMTRGRGRLRIEAPTPSLGEVRCELTVGGRQTHLDALVVPPVMDLIRARLRFVARHQQIDKPNDPMHGALVVYDNETDLPVVHPARTDLNEARERLAMGILLAMFLREEPDAELRCCLDLYYAFVRRELQDANWDVNDGVGRYWRRIYNSPWTAHLHLEMFRLTGDEECLTAFVRTMEAHYRRFGPGRHPIAIPMYEGSMTLAAAGRAAERETLLGLFEQHACRIAADGLAFAAHEVNFEQSVVGPATCYLLEAYLLTRKSEYLEQARVHLRCLETFNGRQPDHRLHEIAMRHWDGYWFGKQQMWGDTLPHYWSAITGVAFHRYWQATGSEDYRRRATANFMNNLSAFTPDGRAYCAYIYPTMVNGAPGKFADPLANDQDWALVFWMMCERDKWGERPAGT